MEQKFLGKKILIVDDDEMMREALSSLLLETGAEIDFGENGQVGFEKVKAVKYDLVISDIQMPKMNGVEFLKNVRSISLTEPKFVLITGFSSYTDEQVKKIGANNLFHKPFEFDTFLNELDVLILNKEGDI